MHTTGNWEVDMFVEVALSDVFWDRASTDADAPIISAAYAAGLVVLPRAERARESMARGEADGISPDNDDAITQVWGSYIAGAAYVAGVQARKAA